MIFALNESTVVKKMEKKVPVVVTGIFNKVIWENVFNGVGIVFRLDLSSLQANLPYKCHFLGIFTINIRLFRNYQ